jgi:hypothetical protein
MIGIGVPWTGGASERLSASDFSHSFLGAKIPKKLFAAFMAASQSALALREIMC